MDCDDHFVEFRMKTVSLNDEQQSDRKGQEAKVWCSMGFHGLECNPNGASSKGLAFNGVSWFRM
jgi:hypothetical protein